MIEPTERMVTVSTTLKQDTLERFNALVKASDLNFSSYLRKMIERHVERRKSPSQTYKRQTA